MHRVSGADCSGHADSGRSRIVTRQQAEEVAKFIQDRLDGRKLWSVTVSETRKVDPEKPTKYRVVIEAAGSALPFAIYSARVLSKPISRDAIL
jgi:hypothetical protein